MAAPPPHVVGIELADSVKLRQGLTVVEDGGGLEAVIEVSDVWGPDRDLPVGEDWPRFVEPVSAIDRS
jgi:hypothetical protein